MSLSTSIKLQNFLQYKRVNKEMLPELVEFCESLVKNRRNCNNSNNNNANKNNKSNKNASVNTNNKKNDNWRNNADIPTGDNWLLTMKLNQTSDDKLYSQIRSLLNKLSDSNFNSLLEELKTYNITSLAHLNKLVELIFSKATSECKFSYMYAKLSLSLANFCITDGNETHSFRRILIKQCQDIFKQCIMDNSTIDKMFGNGCMTFIGELYLHNLLSGAIINSCFLLMLANVGNTAISNPNNIDYISTLMRTTIKKFINTNNKDIENIFDKIEKLIESGTLQTRDKFSLMDLVDIRDAHVFANSR